MSPRGVADPQLSERLLDAADRLVDAHGLHALSVRQVAHEAGVADGALYNHFADKGQLLAALAARRIERAQEELAGALDGPPDGDLQHTVQILITACTSAFSEIIPIAMPHGAGSGRSVHRVAQQFVGEPLVQTITERFTSASGSRSSHRDWPSLARLIVGAGRQLALESALKHDPKTVSEQSARLASLLARPA